MLFLALVAICPVRADTPTGTASSGKEGATSQEPYRISAGDTLSIVVEDEEMLTRECQVNGAGTISYPLLGDVPAAGASCAELKARLEKELTRYLKHPRVALTVEQYGQAGTSVFVMGEVKSPGVYPLASGAGLMQALAAAGGLTEFASGQISVLESRTGQARMVALGTSVSGGHPSNPLLQPGDVVLVDRKLEAKYAVLGEVPKQGMFDMAPRGDVSVLDAMEKAGLLEPPSNSGVRRQIWPKSLLDDPTRVADLEHSTLTRGEEVITLDLAALLRGDTAQNLPLRSGDVLTVPRRPVVTVTALGEVRSPGRQTLPVGATALDLLNVAGGMTSRANPIHGRILRLVGGKATSIEIDFARLLSRAEMKQNVGLQEGDVLFVPPKGEPSPIIRSLISILPYFVF